MCLCWPSFTISYGFCCWDKPSAVEAMREFWAPCLLLSNSLRWSIFVGSLESAEKNKKENIIWLLCMCIRGGMSWTFASKKIYKPFKGLWCLWKWWVVLASHNCGRKILDLGIYIWNGERFVAEFDGIRRLVIA